MHFRVPQPACCYKPSDDPRQRTVRRFHFVQCDSQTAVAILPASLLSRLNRKATPQTNQTAGMVGLVLIYCTTPPARRFVPSSQHAHSLVSSNLSARRCASCGTLQPTPWSSSSRAPPSGLKTSWPLETPSLAWSRGGRTGWRRWRPAAGRRSTTCGPSGRRRGCTLWRPARTTEPAQWRRVLRLGLRWVALCWFW